MYGVLRLKEARQKSPCQVCTRPRLIFRTNQSTSQPTDPSISQSVIAQRLISIPLFHRHLTEMLVWAYHVFKRSLKVNTTAIAQISIFWEPTKPPLGQRHYFKTPSRCGPEGRCQRMGSRKREMSPHPATLVSVQSRLKIPTAVPPSEGINYGSRFPG